MSLYGQKVVAVIDTQSAFGVTSKTMKENVDTLVGQMSTLLADAPETLDTLNEIAAAISDDPAFFTTMASANTTLQNNITALSTAAATARTALQTALQANIDAEALTGSNARGVLGVRLDALELDSVTKTYVDAAVTNLIDAAPGVLDTLNELAAAIGDDENFATTITNNIATVQADVDANETATNNALGLKFDKTGGVLTGSLVVAKSFPDLQLKANDEKRVLFSDAGGGSTAAIKHVSSTLDFFAGGIAASNKEMSIGTDGVDVSALKIDGTAVTATAAEINAVDGRLDVLEADPTTATAVAAVQADVDANELASDNAEAALSTRLDTLEADPTTATAVAAVQSDVDANETASDAAEAALSGRLDVLEADPTTKTYVDTQVAGLVDSAPGVLNTLDELAAALGDDANFATTITNSIAAVQADVDANETASDAAEAALSTRLDTLEADPTTATAVAAVQTDVDANEASRKTYFDWDSNITKVINPVRGTGINVGNNIEMIPAAAGGRVEITGDLVLDASDLTDAADDTAAAAAGVIVGQIYHNSGALRVRLS